MTSKYAVMEAPELSKVLSEVGSGDLNNLTFSRIANAVFQDPDGRSQLKSLLADWDRFSSSFPSKTIAEIIHGYSHFILGDLERAQEVLAKEKRNSWGAYYFVRTALARQAYDEALRAVEDAHQKFPEFHPLTFLMIEVYCKTGREEEILKIFKKLGKELENTSEFALHKGMYHEALSDYGAAIDCYRKAVDLDPQSSHAHFRLAFCLDLYGKGDEPSIDEAIGALEDCLKNFPPYTNAVLNLGILYEDRERYHDAIKCFEAVLRTHPTHERARMFLEDAQASTRMFYDKEEEKKADRQSQVLKIPVSDFELSVRSRNCLQKMNILTLGDLIMKTEQELLSYKNFGETSLKEIKDMLAQKGLRLGQGLDQPGNELNAPRNPLEAVIDPGILNKPIEELSLSVRSRRCMERLGVKSVRDLINKTEVQLMAAKNFGMTSLNEIKRKLAEFGLKLRG